MLWKILFRILRRHAAFHLLIPLFVGYFFHALVSNLVEHRPWKQLASDLVSFRSLVFAGGVFAAYLLIMYYLIRKETSIRLHGNDLAVLNSTLSTASCYFATSTIGMKEWFDPVSQIFLATIIKQKTEQQVFRDERVLLFCGRKDIDTLDSMYLDGYYARRIADIHVQYGTPLAYLSKPEIHKILRELSHEQRKAIRCYPAPMFWCPEWLFDRLPLFLQPLRKKGLDFALVEHRDGTRSVLVIFKEGENVRIRRLKGERAEPYESLVELIRKTVYRSGAQPEEKHDFIKFYYPFGVFHESGTDARAATVAKLESKPPAHHRVPKEQGS